MVAVYEIVSITNGDVDVSDGSEAEETPGVRVGCNDLPDGRKR